MKSIRVALAFLVLVFISSSSFAQGSEEIVYFHSDAIGSVRLVTDANGQVVGQYDYLPFGEAWLAPALPETRRFGGKERDSETGLDYFGARYYSVLNGRFTVVDPVLDAEAATTNPQRWNRYAYGSNNPLRNVDPDGRDTLDLAVGFAQGVGKTLVGAVTGLVTAPYALATDFRGTVDGAAAAASEHIRLLSFGVHNPALVWEAYSGLATSANDADQRALGQIFGGASATTALLVSPAAEARAGSAAAFRAGLTRTADLEPTHGITMSGREFARLKADIAENGIREPIKYVEHNGQKYVVDGNHRLRAAKALGIRQVPTKRVELPFGGYRSADDLINMDR